MSSPPYGGFINSIPDIGYRNTTIFLISCDGWKSDIPYPLTTRFYARR